MKFAHKIRAAAFDACLALALALACIAATLMFAIAVTVGALCALCAGVVALVCGLGGHAHGAA